MVRWKHVPRIWEGGECWIIGGGPSVTRQFGIPEEIIRAVSEHEKPPSVYSPYFEPIHDKHVIGINNAYQIGEWIEVMFFGDASWYLVHKQPLAKWPGIKTTCCPRFENRPKEAMEGIKFLPKDREHKYGISSTKGHVSWNNNSGTASISLAHQFGVKRIILLGFDMRMDEADKYSHWHGSHHPFRDRQHKPPFKRHMKGWTEVAKDADLLGIEIINASPESSIDVFPRTTVKELLDVQRKTIETVALDDSHDPGEPVFQRV